MLSLSPSFPHAVERESRSCLYFFWFSNQLGSKTMDHGLWTTEKQTWIPAQRHTGMTEREVAYGDDGEETPSLVLQLYTTASLLLHAADFCRSFTPDVPPGSFTRRYTSQSLTIASPRLHATRFTLQFHARRTIWQLHATPRVAVQSAPVIIKNHPHLKERFLWW